MVELKNKLIAILLEDPACYSLVSSEDVGTVIAKIEQAFKDAGYVKVEPAEGELAPSPYQHEIVPDAAVQMGVPAGTHKILCEACEWDKVCKAELAHLKAQGWHPLSECPKSPMHLCKDGQWKDFPLVKCTKCNESEKPDWEKVLLLLDFTPIPNLIRSSDEYKHIGALNGGAREQYQNDIYCAERECRKCRGEA